MRYSIAPEVFERYPGFMRVVLVAEGIHNQDENPELAARLESAQENARSELNDAFKELPQLAVWADAFRSMQINPNKYPPSVINLIKRVRGGKNLPYVNTLVAAFNCISLRHLCPCGGDDLDAVKGDLLLAPAAGDECYVPLGQAGVTEHPPGGEIVYIDTATRLVLCRAWCWKNGDSTKLLPETKRAAINIDIMPPLGQREAEKTALELRELLEQHAGASVRIQLLDRHTPSFAL